YAAVLFDEFHERSIHTDTALAFLRETVAALRPDLRIVAMSATLDADTLATRLRTDAVVRVDAERHPVAVTHRPPEPGDDLTDAAAATIVDVVGSSDHVGDVLVFLPGVGAINRVDRALRRSLAGRLGDDLVITPLHGSLRSDDQDAALRRDPQRRRKIVLATPLAETSVTVDGVATVIDTGQRRRPEIDHGRGMGVLRTVTASRAAADQRAGRAGRQRPGTCVRLWHAGDEAHRPTDEPPEITTADLSSLALDIAAWGATDVHELPWLDAPPAPALTQARALLVDLGLLDGEHRLTAHGRAAHRLGADPRLAHLLVRSVDLEPEYPGAVATACLLAAALADRDLLRGRRRPVDLRLRLDTLLGARRDDADPQARRSARETARRWERRLGVDGAAADLDLTGLLASIAFPDRIARRRDDGASFLLASGAGVTIDPDDGIARRQWLAVAETDGVSRDARIVTAAPLHLDDIEAVHADRIVERDEGGWDRRARDVVFERQSRLGSLILQRRPETSPDAAAVAAGLVAGLRREGLGLLRWEDTDRRVRDRMAFVHGHEPETWPAVDDETLLATADSWLAPRLDRTSRRKDLAAIAARDVLTGLLDWRQGRELDRLAPTHWDVPSGSRVPIDYAPEGGPVLAVRLQELFGLTESPAVLGGRVPLTLHLLSPAHRPVQVTQDLASFWAEGYAEVRRELRGRYPKHRWPEDPLTATPTNRAKRRS
ncbi:MAG: ATP-dependent helicase HrpB, partial [Actinomycetota bacterium]